MVDIVAHLKGVRRSGKGWTAKCPAHEDKQNSLSVHHRDGKWLLKCHAGCTWEAIIAAMGVAPGDLFDQSEGKGAGHPRNNRATAQLPGMTLEQYAAASNVLMALIDEGLPCFPCHLNKKPATPHGYKDATSNRETVTELWMRYPAPLIGVPTGELSGLDVLDIDQRHSGDSWLQQRRARLPTTRVHQTRSGGFHLFFQHESGLRCSAGRIATGVDVRADGGYVIWWPGVGLPVTSEMPVAPWPNWLLQQFSSSPRRISSRIRVPDDHALVHLIRLVASARDGERNNLTFWAACRTGEMVRSGLLRAEDAAALIAEAATRAGLPRPEAERTAWNGIRMTGGLSYA
jgi:hypothetical protein